MKYIKNHTSDPKRYSQTRCTGSPEGQRADDSTRRTTGSAFVGDEMVLMQAPAWPLVQNLTWPPVRALTRALRHLSPTHKTCDESYLNQGFAAAVGILRKCGDESVGENPSLRKLRKLL
jgi:hypothetical protein